MGSHRHYDLTMVHSSTQRRWQYLLPHMDFSMRLVVPISHNGQVERTVRTVKQLLKKSTDPHLSLLVYRSTPLSWCNYSPAELLMGRRILFTLPILTQHLKPDWSYQCSCQKFVSKVGGLLGSMWLMNITCCGQCVYTCAVYCNNNDCFYDCLLWRCHKIMLWLTINLLVGVTRTSCSLGGLYIIWMVKGGMIQSKGGNPLKKT